MARDATVRTVLTANDQASGPLRNFQNTLKGVKSEMGDTNEIAGMLKGGIAGIAAAAGIDMLMQLGGAMMELGRAGEQALILRDAFEQTATGVGASAASMLSDLKAASGGMIADTDLMLAANRAMMLGVADSSAEMAQLLEVAAVRGRAMGLSTSQAFNDLVTGLGRMSPLILDNLGIVTGGEAVFSAYAASIGKTADALTDAERKQALFNKVVASTDLSGEVIVSQFERMDAAIQNAKTALGELFGPAIAQMAQSLADSVTEVTDAITTDKIEAAQKNLWEFGNTVLELSQKLQDLNALSAVTELGGDANQFATIQEDIRATTDMLLVYVDNYNQAAAVTGAPLIDPESIKRGEIAYLDAAGAAEYLGQKAQEAAGKQEQATSSGQMLAGAMAYLAQTSYSAAGAVSSAQSAVSSIIGTLASAAAAGYDMAKAMALVNQFRGLDTQAQKIREGLGNLGFYEPEQIDLIVQVNNQKAINEVNELVGAFNNVESTIKSISSVTPGLVEDMGLDRALAWQREQETSLRAQAEHLRAIGYTDEQIAVALRSNVMETQAWASSLDKVSSATNDIEQSISSLQGRVLGAIQSATQGDIGLDLNEFLPREDAVNENARRLAAIMRDGFANQPWLEEFKQEVPGVFAELAASGDIQGSAARILQDFQAGLRPELLDMGAIKEKIKNEIAGEMAMQAQAAQLTADLIADTGGDSADIQAKVAKALGLGIEQADITGGILGDLNSATFQAQLTTAATGAGKGWGNMFLQTVGGNVPQELISILTNLVTPNVLAQIQLQNSQTGATP